MGEVLSPADVYKTRLGLPTQSPYAARVAAIERSRFVSLAEAKNVPYDRIRQITPEVREVWAPVYAKTDSTDLATILLTSQQQVGWSVREVRTIPKRERLADEQREVIQSVQIQASDAFYDGYYPTVPGNDPVMINGEVLRAPDGTVIRGGTQIRGRTQYERKTAGMVHWDKGFVRERNKALAEEASRPIRNVQANLERVAGEVLPMHRILANGRVDRRSAV